MTVANMSLDDLGKQAGAGDVVMRYLDQRGIKSVSTLALVAQDRDHFASRIIQPLLDGFKKGAAVLQVDEDEKPIASAILECMWAEARLWWQQRQSPSSTPTTTPALTTATPPSSSPTTWSSDKTPKSLPPQVWQQQVAKYNAVTVNGRPRRFPEQELLGAESVLARTWHEHVVAKQYSPVHLGELLQKRSFTAAGEVNQLAKSSRKHNLVVEENNIVQEEDQTILGNFGAPWPSWTVSTPFAVRSCSWRWGQRTMYTPGPTGAS